jgi:hypothetical protein
MDEIQLAITALLPTNADILCRSHRFFRIYIKINTNIKIWTVENP